MPTGCEMLPEIEYRNTLLNILKCDETPIFMRVHNFFYEGGLNGAFLVRVHRAFKERQNAWENPGQSCGLQLVLREAEGIVPVSF